MGSAPGAEWALRSPPVLGRTLLLVLVLIVLSLAAWLICFRVFERAPRAATIAQQIVSIAQLTRAALIYADPYVRRDLLAELASNEGIRIAPLEPGDVVVPMPERSLLRLSGGEILTNAEIDSDRLVADQVAAQGFAYVLVNRARAAGALEEYVDRVLPSQPIAEDADYSLYEVTAPP